MILVFVTHPDICVHAKKMSRARIIINWRGEDPSWLWALGWFASC